MESLIGIGWIAVGVIAVIIVLFMLMKMYANRYTKVGPNEVLGVSGLSRKLATGRPWDSVWSKAAVRSSGRSLKGGFPVSGTDDAGCAPEGSLHGRRRFD